MTQDDAHIFCTRGADGRRARTRSSTSCSTCCATSASTTSTSSCRPGPRARPSARDEEWDEATDALRRGAERHGLELVIDEGGGAFYGPKISVAGARRHRPDLADVAPSSSTSRPPQRFELEYVGADNARHRPIMIHRALFGSVERFFAILLEHYAGALPTWLAPEQVRVLGVRDDHEAYADEVADRPAGASGSGSRSTRPTSRSGPGSAGPSWRRSPTSWWSATTTWPPAPSGSTAGGATGPTAACRLDRVHRRAARRDRRRIARGAAPAR